MPSAVRPESDTVSLSEAALIFGIAKSLAYRQAKAGQELTRGVPILRFGSDTRPVYRVSRAAIDAALEPSEAAS